MIYVIDKAAAEHVLKKVNDIINRVIEIGDISDRQAVKKVEELVTTQVDRLKAEGFCLVLRLNPTYN